MELITQDIKMTSIELSEITGKEHKNILRDIRDEIEKLGEKGKLIFDPTKYLDSFNRKQEQFTFGKKGAMQIALRYGRVIYHRRITQYGRDFILNNIENWLNKEAD